MEEEVGEKVRGEWKSCHFAATEVIGAAPSKTGHLATTEVLKGAFYISTKQYLSPHNIDFCLLFILSFGHYVICYMWKGKSTASTRAALTGALTTLANSIGGVEHVQSEIQNTFEIESLHITVYIHLCQILWWKADCKIKWPYLKEFCSQTFLSLMLA